MTEVRNQMTEVRGQKSDELSWFFGYRLRRRSFSRPRRRTRPRMCIEHSRQELPFLEDEDEYEKNRIKSYAFALRPQPFCISCLPLPIFDLIAFLSLI
jgi:hypothetical protein